MKNDISTNNCKVKKLMDEKEEIDNLVENQKNITTSRKYFSDLLMGDLREGTPNIEVINHINSILQNVALIYEKHVKLSYFIDKDANFSHLKKSVDLSQAMSDVSNKNYFYALTYLEDFLLRYNHIHTQLELFEIYIVYFFLEGILLSAEAV